MTVPNSSPSTPTPPNQPVPFPSTSSYLFPNELSFSSLLSACRPTVFANKLCGFADANLFPFISESFLVVGDMMVSEGEM